VAFAPDGESLFLVGKDHTLKVFHAATGKERFRLRGHTSNVGRVAWGRAGHVASISLDGTVRLWVPAGQEARTPALPRLDRGSLSRDGRLLAGMGLGPDEQGNAVKVLDVQTGQEIMSWPLPPRGLGDVQQLQFSPDARLLGGVLRGVEGGKLRTVLRVWDTATGAPVVSVPAPPSGRVQCLAFHPDGRRLAAVAARRLELWDLSAAKAVLSVPTPGRWIGALEFTPDGQGLLGFTFDSNENEVKCWDVATGKERRAWKWSGPRPSCLAASPDGELLAVGSDAGVVRVWRLHGDQPALVLRGHEQVVRHVAFSRDGKRLASAGLDGTIKVWDPWTGRELLALPGGEAEVTRLAFGGDGVLVAVDLRGGVRLFDGSPWQEPPAAGRDGQQKLP
jgi:WD40 repeat protein